ncbi:MAG: neutral zinc metallopeptidase, partial [Candidatus Rokuibacteriota bacterium]
MRWTRGERSQDIEDRRGETPSGGGMGFRVGGGIGLGGALILLVLSLVFGQNFFALLDGGGDVSPGPGGGAASGPPREGGAGGGARAGRVGLGDGGVESTRDPAVHGLGR